MSTNQNQALEIQLRVPKESYAVGEPMDVTVILKNHSNAPVTINKRMGINPTDMPEGYWELRFAFTYQTEAALFPGPPVNRGKPRAKDFTVLSPEGEMSWTYTLTDWHRIRLQGDYQVKAIYHNSVDGSQFGLSAWTGEITSNPVNLKVTE